jgi:hypothetical protein
MQPVWVLSVDLQTKTATFQSGLSDAAKSARGAFSDIKSGAGQMGRETSYSMMEARHGVMLLGEEFGVHLPRALTSFIASIGPIGAAMEAAFPFLAVAVGATLLIEHLAKLREAGIQLTEDQEKFGTAAQNAFNKLEDKILQSKIRADELNHDSMGALRLQLELIDHQSMEELVHSFEEVAKAAEVVMKELEGSWYTFGIGSDGAKAALEGFKTKYEHLLSLRTDAGKEEASNLLTGTLKTAQDVLHAQQIIKANRDSGDGQTDDSFQAERTLEIHKASLTVTKSEIAAQEAIVKALQTQADIEKAVAEHKALDSGNATKSAGKEGAAHRAAAQREAAESQLRMGEMAISSDRAVAKSQLDIHRASVEERLKSDIDFADREQSLHLAANQAEIAALDKSDKSYQNQLQAHKDKALEISAQHEATVAELTARAATESAARDLRLLEFLEQEKIEAEEKGSAARLAVLDAAIKEEESKGLQDTEHYRGLRKQRVEVDRQIAEESARVKDAAIKQEIAAEEVARKEMARHSGAMEKTKPQNNEFAEKKAELDRVYNENHAEKMREMADAAKMGKDRVATEHRILAEIQALDKKHVNETQEIAAQEVAAHRQAAAMMANNYAQGFLRVAEGQESLSRMANQVAESIISNSLKALIATTMHAKDEQLAQAKVWASGAGSAVAKIPFVGPILAPVAAAAGFLAAMAFEQGGIVPGTGSGDVVPAMLTPGEGVVPKGVMEGLSNLSKSGGLESGGTHYHAHVRPVYNLQAIDATGVQKMLENHSSVLQRHVEGTLRKMNR